MNVAEKDIEKTSISIPGRSIMFKRACFGLKNIPAVFQNVMMEIFQIDGVFIYIDIIIVGTTFDEFYKRLQRVLQCARNRRVNIGLRKCKFVTSKHPIDILGSTFQDKTRFISKKKIEALMRIPRPKSVKEVRSLVGSINYIREWLPGISESIAPINELIKGKPRVIKWTIEHDDYLKQIKDLIINHMPLELPAPGKRVLISTDASDVAVGGVIWQEIDSYSPAGTPLNKRKVKPLSFYSRLLTETQRKWSTLQKELYAILLILTESCLESYLLTRHLTIFTDHKNIAFLATAPEKNRIVKRWLPILSEFDFDIVHETDEDNHWADMLSRNIDLDQNEETASICSINIPDTLLSNYEIPPIDDDSDSDFEDIPSISSLSRHQDLPIFSSWFSKIRSEQQIAKNNNDPLFENAILDENTQIWKNNENKILIPKCLRKQALLLIHELVQSGHPSKNDSLHKLSKSDFFWPNMRKDLINHIKRCPTCQKTAPVNRIKTPSTGSLWANRPFARLNVDTIGPLNTDSDGNKYLLVFVDSFTGYSILVPLKELNALETADALIWNVCAIFGIPMLIHSDNGPEFANETFKIVCNRLAIEMSNSIPHYSESNGLVERKHRDVLQCLRKLLIDFNDYGNWSTYVPISQLLINSTKSRKTVFNIGDHVLRKTKQNNKLHGSWNGPFLVIDRPSNSTLLLKNLITGSELKAAKKDCKIYNADNPQDIEFLKAVAAGDAEKHVIEKILSEYNSDSGSFCTVQWFGGETTEEPLHSVKHSEAYKLFSRNNKKIGKRTTSQRKSTSNNSAPCKRPRRSTRIRK
ncbi:hypothetical protein P9112_002863 [Eukaryota sp. TZLM1-RC]